MISNPICVVFSDIHHHDWKTHNQDNRRTKAGFKAMLEIGSVAKQLGVPILFAGDFGHAFGKVSLDLWYEIVDTVNLWIDKGYPCIYGISGNHDQEGATYGEDQASKSLWELISKIWPKVFWNVDFATWVIGDLKLYGMAHMTYNKSLVHYIQQFGKERRDDKINILLLHSDLHGAVEANGREVGTVEEVPENMDEFFHSFDLVISGHIHRAQKLGRKVLIPGSPMQQKKNDTGADYGYWIIFKKDTKLIKKFIPLFDYPKFVQLKPGEEAPSNGKDFYLSAEEKETEEEVVDLGFHNTTSKEKIVRRYMKQIGEDSLAKRKALLRTLELADDL